MQDVVGLTVGRRIRRRRRLLGMTQTELGEACDVTFQQVQKYESAACRVPVALLWRLSRALCVDMNYFFQGLEEQEIEAPARADSPPLLMAV